MWSPANRFSTQLYTKESYTNPAVLKQYFARLEYTSVFAVHSFSPKFTGIEFASPTTQIDSNVRLVD